MKSRQQVFGQNFLHHKPSIDRIIGLIDREITHYLNSDNLKPKSVVEVGPGKLALTNPLYELVEKYSLPLILVERDHLLESEIREKIPQCEFHLMDAATEKLRELLLDLEKRGLTPVYFASNLPYSAGSQILAQLCREARLVCGMTVMVQKEVALRMAATATKKDRADRGSLSLLIQSHFEAKLEFDVNPSAFIPPPKVMSSIVSLRVLEKQLVSQEDTREFENFCKMLFSHRRKMIRAILPEITSEHFTRAGLEGTERPEVLELDKILQLWNFYRNLKK